MATKLHVFINSLCLHANSDVASVIFSINGDRRVYIKLSGKSGSNLAGGRGGHPPFRPAEFDGDCQVSYEMSEAHTMETTVFPRAEQAWIWRHPQELEGGVDSMKLHTPFKLVRRLGNPPLGLSFLFSLFILFMDLQSQSLMSRFVLVSMLCNWYLLGINIFPLLNKKN
jgi:hypothetical protein